MAQRRASRRGKASARCLVENLFTGPGRTTLSPGEILVALHLPPPAPRSAAAYLRFTPRREMDIAIAGVGAWVQLDAGGQIAAARIALASVAPTPIRAPAAEQALIGQAPSRDLVKTAAQLAARRLRADFRYAWFRRIPPASRRRADAPRARRLFHRIGHSPSRLHENPADSPHQRRGARGARRHPRHAARIAARPAGIDRHQGRLRQRQLRLVHGVDGWRAGECLPRPGAGSSRQPHHDDRGDRRATTNSIRSSRPSSSTAARSAASARPASS